MNKKQLILTAAISGALSIGTTAFGGKVSKAGVEKCYGVAKAGQNDCSAKNGSHGCSKRKKSADGKIIKDYDPNEWKYVKKGTCDAMQSKVKAMMSKKKK